MQFLIGSFLLKKILLQIENYQLNKSTATCIVEFMKEHNGDNSCSIYQFGLHELDHKFHGYVYRSINGFVCEENKTRYSSKTSRCV